VEAETLQKILVYSAVAVVLGLLLTLIPSAIIRTERANTIAGFLFGEVEEFRRDYGLDAPKYSVAGLEILAISVIIAFFGYMLVKWRMPH